MILYGIPTCDTCRKAMKALSAAGHPVRLHDVRAEPLTRTQIAAFLDRFGDKLINRASTTWRTLPEAERQGDPAALLARHPTLMKRPVIATGDTFHLGFGPDVQSALLK